VTGALLVCAAAAAVGGLRDPGGHARAAESSGGAVADVQPAVRIGAAHGASYVPALQGRRPLFLLVLGSDERHRLQGKRADSIHIIGIDLAHRRATILGIPRDSWVAIPGFGHDKINASLQLGGPSLTVRTVESLTGIRIDFWILTTFKGFKAMVDGIGGLKIDVPYAMHDPYSGSNFEPGVRRMNGKQALAFSRDRHSTPGGDLGRSGNQGRVLLSALSKLRDRFAKDPGTLFDWIGVGWRQIDTDLSVSTLLDLGLTATQVASRDVNNVVVPATTGNVGAASVVFISSAAQPLYADMKHDGVIGARGR